MSARTQLAAALTEALPQYRVLPAADTPDRVTRTTLLLFQNNVTRMEQISHDRLRVDVVLWVLVGNEDPQAAETALEDGLDDVIGVLRPLTWADWTTAERMTYGEPDGPSFHGYKLTVTTLATIGD